MNPEDKIVKPWLRHPITEMTHGKRLTVISNALKKVARVIARDAEDKEFLEEIDGLWTDEFFRSLDRDPEGLFVEAILYFCPARNRQFGGFDLHSLKCETMVDHDDLTGCSVSTETEIMFGIPSEEG